jgi:hypothetical protein
MMSRLSKGETLLVSHIFGILPLILALLLILLYNYLLGDFLFGIKCSLIVDVLTLLILRFMEVQVESVHLQFR